MPQIPPIVDCSLYFRETDMFRARLSHLKDVVDCFVVVEATTDHAGRPNEPRLPTLFDADPEFYNQFPIRHVVTNLPAGSCNWPRVYAHRNAILEGLNWTGTEYEIPDHALVLVSDIDEFPRREILHEMRFAFAGEPYNDEGGVTNALRGVYGQLGHGEPRVVWFLNQMFYYDLHTTRDAPWLGTRLTTARDLRHVSPEVIRRWPAPVHVFENAGWHFSYFGGVKAIQEKVSAIAESAWLNRVEFTDGEHLKECITQSKDLYNRDGEGWVRRDPPTDIPIEIVRAFGMNADVLEDWK